MSTIFKRLFLILLMGWFLFESAYAQPAPGPVGEATYGEGSTHVDGDIGALMLGVRNDSGSPLAADGKYIPFTFNSSGALYVTGGGSGTEYTEGDTDASITGSAILGEAPSNTLKPFQLNSNFNLKISLEETGLDFMLGTDFSNVFGPSSLVSGGRVLVDGSGVTQPVSGTVTVTDGSGPLTVDGTVTITPSGTQTVAISQTSTNNDVDANITNASIAVTQGTATNLKTQAEAYQGGSAVAAGNPLQVTLANGSVPSHAVTNAGTFAVQESGAALTALQLIDDPVFSDDAAFTPATSKVHMIGAEFDDVTPDSVDEGDAGAPRMSANRNLYVRIRDNAGNERGLNIDSNGALAATVTNATAANLNATVVGTGTFATQSAITAASGSIAAGAIAAGATSIADNEDVASADADRLVKVAAIRDDTLNARSGTEGDYEQLHLDANGALWVDLNIAGAAAVSGSGTATGALRVELPTNGTGVVGLNSGSNTIGKISDITTSIVPGTGATNLGKAEDAAHSSGDTGVMLLGVRRATATDLSAGATDGDYEPVQVDANGRLHVVNSAGIAGDVAHDAVDSGNPIKIGGKATDYTPDTEDAQGQSDVAAGDRTNQAHNLKGEQIEGVNSMYHLFDGTFPDTGLNGTYDDSPKNSTSEAVNVWNYRECGFFVDISKANTPTDILFTLQVSSDGTNYQDYSIGLWTDNRESNATIGSGGIKRHYPFKATFQKVKVKATATGTDASNTITLANSGIYCRN